MAKCGLQVQIPTASPSAQYSPRDDFVILSSSTVDRVLCFDFDEEADEASVDGSHGDTEGEGWEAVGATDVESETELLKPTDAQGLEIPRTDMKPERLEERGKNPEFSGSPASASSERTAVKGYLDDGPVFDPDSDSDPFPCDTMGA